MSYNKNKIWVLGPCSIENEQLFRDTLKHLYKIMEGRNWYFKGSFDKANRTSLGGSRGPGLDVAIPIYKNIKSEFCDIKLTTDVHETSQVESLKGIIDCIQIPAFLCRQTDLIVECSKNFDIINIKKGQWLGPNNLIKSVDKIRNTNQNCEAWITDRGSNFGYHELFVDFGMVDQLKLHYDKVILDCTHSIQRSRAVYGNQGDRRLAERYFVAADVFGYDGIFAEVHPKPEVAISDSDCQLYLNKIQTLIKIADNVGKSTLGLKNQPGSSTNTVE